MIRCGVDLIENERIERALNRFGTRFLQRFLTEAEQRDCGEHVESMAVRVAAKEAVAKLLGTGIGAVRWVEIEVRRTEGGRPFLNLYGQAALHAQALGLVEWDISLSHTATTSIAMVIAQ
ncbi:MAG UNVERIFIED_CONTAM: holo-ACP synthase [Anaerolineae bacterium]|jgi:holo-[acyl-carrier protein] synthase